MQHLVVLVPVGLGLDIVGFILVVRYAHSLFIHITSDAIPDANLGRDGDVVFSGVAGGASVDRADVHRKYKAWAGVALVVVGFGLQMAGAIFGILE